LTLLLTICFQDASRAAKNLAGITKLKDKAGKLAKKAAKGVAEKKHEAAIRSKQKVPQDHVLIASRKPSMQPLPPNPVLLAAAKEDEAGIPCLEPMPPDPVD
jgi:hypothetical protein